MNWNECEELEYETAESKQKDTNIIDVIAFILGIVTILAVYVVITV